MRLLVLSSLYPSTDRPRHGIFIENRIRQLSAMPDVDVRVVCPVPWFPFAAGIFGRYAAFARVQRRERRHGIEVRYPRFPLVPKVGMSIAPLLMASAMRREARALRDEGFDFDVIDSYYLYPDGVAGALVGARLDRPVVMSALGSDVNVLPRYRVPRAMIRWAAARAEAITTVCAALKDRLAEIGVPDERVDVVRHGVDAALFRPPHRRERLRERLGLHRRTLLAVGNLVPLKGFAIAIRALTRLPETELVIIGDGEEQQSLHALADELGLAERVRMIDNVEQARLAQWYGAADALVIPSSSEGIPNVSLEAMACGTPVIATPVGGLPEVVDEPAAGELMTERTPQALAEAAEHVFEKGRDEQATRALAMRFTWERTRRTHLAVLEHAIHAHHVATQANSASYTDR